MESKQSPKSANQTDNKNSSNQLVESKRIENTPFCAIKYDNDERKSKWFLAIGKHRISEFMETEEQVIENAKDTSWFRLMQVIQFMIDDNEERKTLNKTIEEQKMKMEEGMNNPNGTTPIQ